jgi:Na+-transporting NADH:ubiquinone oxidoreductase subunit NqrE
MLSALYLAGYLSMAAFALILGAVATAWGLGLAVDLGAAAITIISIVTLGLTIVTHEDSSTNEGTR